MRSPKEHLAYLVELAAKPSERRELVRELAELLTAWPADYPVEARASFAALLSHAEHDIDPEARRALALKLMDCNDAPLSLLNEFFFEVTPTARAKILARGAVLNATPVADVDERALVAAARNRPAADFVKLLAVALGIDTLTATEILQDATATGIAIVCRGARLSRATFSTLAVLALRGEVGERLSAFDAVPEKGATAMLAFWHKLATAHAHPQAA